MQAQALVSVTRNPKVEDFAPGDTVRVSFRVREGERERVQVFQGVVIRNRGGGVGATFTVRRVTYSIGVERVFPLYSPGWKACKSSAVVWCVVPASTT